MDVKKDIKDDVLTAAVSGRLDTNTAPEFLKSVEADLDGIKTLNIDLSDLEYISSAGLRALLALQKRASADMTVKNPQNIVMDVFKMTGFDQVLNIK